MKKKLIYQTLYHSPLGEMTLLADENALLGVYFRNQKYFQRGYENVIFSMTTTPILKEALAWLDAYFAGKASSSAKLKLSPSGSPFQEKVWEVLKTIPYGETLTYGQIAEQLNCASSQAVGGAVGKNPLSLIIPCHRVLGANGQLTGYAGGLDKKAWLLNHERKGQK